MATIAQTIFSIFTRLEIWQIDLWQFRTLVLPGNGKTLNRANLSWGQNSAGRLSVKGIGFGSRFSTILTLLLSSTITAISYFTIWENWPNLLHLCHLPAPIKCPKKVEEIKALSFYRSTDDKTQQCATRAPHGVGSPAKSTFWHQHHSFYDLLFNVLDIFRCILKKERPFKNF